MIRVKKSYETENDLSKMIIYFCVCLLQLFGRLMTLRIFFLIDMDNIWHIVWIAAHILVELICIKLLFECPPLPNKGQNIKKVCLSLILSFKDFIYSSEELATSFLNLAYIPHIRQCRAAKANFCTGVQYRCFKAVAALQYNFTYHNKYYLTYLVKLVISKFSTTFSKSKNYRKKIGSSHFWGN